MVSVSSENWNPRILSIWLTYLQMSNMMLGMCYKITQGRHGTTGERDWTELITAETAWCVACCVPPTRLPFSADAAACPQALSSACRSGLSSQVAPLQAPAPSSGPPAPPATQLQARGGSHVPSSGSTLCCKHPVYSHLFIMKPTVQEQLGGRVHRARHSGRTRNPHSPPAPPS